MKKILTLAVTVLFSLSVAINPVLSSDPDTLKKTAIEVYNKGQYPKAADLLKPLVQQFPKDDNLRIKYAYSLLQLKQYAQAKEEFEYVVKNSKNKKLIDYSNKVLATIPKQPSLSSATYVPQNNDSDSQRVQNPQNGDAISSVKMLLFNVSRVKKFSELPEYFTNESAASFGIIMLMVFKMVRELAKNFGGENDPDWAKIEKQFQQLEIRYSLGQLNFNGDMDEKKLELLSKKVAPQGRRFLSDIAVIIEKMEKMGSQQSKKDNDYMKEFSQLNPNEFTYKQLSATRVQITSPKEKTPLEARYEDGKWRLHFGSMGDFRQLNKFKENTN